MLLSLWLVGSAFTSSAPQDDPVHPPEYWKDVLAKKGALPDGENAFDLLEDLFRNLGSTDPVLRDDCGYGITYQWMVRQRLLEPEDCLVLVEQLCENLAEGIDGPPSDLVFLRSFSALNLSLFAQYDLTAHFMEPGDVQTLLETALLYLEEERDLRAHDPDKGWIHAAAHTADLLKFLGRSEHLDEDGRDAIYDGIATRLVTAGRVFTHNEDERLGHAVLSLLARDDADVDAFDRFLADLMKRSQRRPDVQGFDPNQHAARTNARHLMWFLFVTLSTVSEPSAAVVQAKDGLLAQLSPR